MCMCVCGIHRSQSVFRVLVHLSFITKHFIFTLFHNLFSVYSGINTTGIYILLPYSASFPYVYLF